MLWPAVAGAEPHFSARTGLRCARCHTNPTGGGKRTPYGALYGSTSLRMRWQRPHAVLPRQSDDGNWLTALRASGEVTEWLAVGADLRVQNSTTFGDDRDNTFDATGGSLYLELRPWPERITLYVDEEVAAGGARSREAWGLIHGPFASYLKAGWMLPAYGLRLLDDGAYTRRATGVGFANSDMGLELGLDRGPLLLALSVTNGSFSAVDSDHYKALYGHLELAWDPLRVGLSGAYNPSTAGCRAMGAAFAALRLGRVVLQAEADLIGDRPPHSGRWGRGVAALGQLELLLTQGLNLHLGYDYHDADLQLSGDRRQRLVVGIDLFPLPNVEAKLTYVHKQSETTLPQDEADRLEVTLHVYL